MTEQLKEIINNLNDFGNSKNERYISALWDISESTTDDFERDQAIELLLYCEGNENGPLGMKSASEIRHNIQDAVI